MQLDVQSRMLTYETNKARAIKFVRHLTPHIKTYTRLLSHSDTARKAHTDKHTQAQTEETLFRTKKSTYEKSNKDIYDRTQLNKNEIASQIFDKTAMHQSKKSNTLTSVDESNTKKCADLEPSNSDKKEKKNSFNSVSSVPWVEGKARENEEYCEREKVVNSSAKKTCLCYPVAWNLLSSSCLSRGQLVRYFTSL